MDKAEVGLLCEIDLKISMKSNCFIFNNGSKEIQDNYPL